MRRSVERAAAGDESDGRDRCVAVDGERREVILRVLPHTGDSVGDDRSVGSSESDLVSGSEVAEPEEDARSGCRIDMTKNDRRADLTGCDAAFEPAGNAEAVGNVDASIGIETE